MKSNKTLECTGNDSERQDASQDEKLRNGDLIVFRKQSTNR